MHQFWFSIWESLVTCGLSLLIGGGLALLEHYLKVKQSKIFSGLMALPVFLPGIIVATGFIVVWGNGGWVNDLLAYFDIGPIKFLYSAGAIIAGNCFYNIPLAYLAVSIRLLSLNPYLEESGEIMGASAWKSWQTITWPRLRGTIIGIGLVIFLYSFLSFALPLILGGIKYQTLEVYIYTLATQQLNLSAALWLAILQFIFLLLIILIFIKYIKIIYEKKVQPRISGFSKNILLIWILRIIIGLFVLLPLIAILIKGNIISNFTNLITVGFLPALLRSLLVAIFSVSASMIIGLLFLLRKKPSSWLIVLLAVSPVMLGVGFLFWWGKSYTAMALAYIIMLVPLVYYFLMTLWNARPAFFMESIKIMGANPKQQILASMNFLMPAIKRALALGIVLVMGDIAVASMLAPFLKPTAMSLSYQLLGSYRFSMASAGMSIVLIIILVMILLIYGFRSKVNQR